MQRKKNAYPKFFRRSDQLIKIGWSKKEKKEYQHKAPKDVIALLCNTLLNAGGGAKILSTDDLFPLQEKNGSEVPTYQAYVCLAWLRSEGLVTREGRQGYRVPNAKALADSLSVRWESLSEV